METWKIYLLPSLSISLVILVIKIENVYIGAKCSHAEIQEYIELFKEFHDIFAWSYNEMPGIDPRIVEHEIKTYPNAKHNRQHLHAMNPSKSTRD